MSTFTFDPDYDDRSPPSTAPSSPTHGPVESSPPSSPEHAPISLNETPPTSPTTYVGGGTHPFAGSAKSTRPPPQYERKTPLTSSNTHASPSTLYTGSPGRSVGNGGLAVLSRDPHVPVPRNDEFVQRMLQLGAASTKSTKLKRSSVIQPKSDHELWDEKIRYAIENPAEQTVIDLSGDFYTHQLSTISPNIKDLANLVVLPEPTPVVVPLRLHPPPSFSTRTFGRVHTAPASAFALSSASSRGVTRAESEILPTTIQSAPARPPMTHEVRLFLHQNLIRSLPLELFSLQSLTVLSLRNNQLTYIPPEITRLTSLQELSLAHNKLTYLPYEMFSMHLRVLTVTPNPFLTPPSGTTPQPGIIPALLEDNTTTIRRPPLSEPIRRLERVPPLTELCLRVLIAPAPVHIRSRFTRSVSQSSASSLQQNNAPLTNLEVLYEIIQPAEAHISPSLLSILAACVPGAVATTTSTSSHFSSSLPEEPSTDGRVSPGVCPAPHHVAQGERRAFLRHAEERFTWEHTIAGVSVSAAPGVPIRWRGCSHGCLDFLEDNAHETEGTPTNDDDDGVQVGVVRFEAGSGGLGFDIGIGEDF